jgi:hypothetical protein
VACDSAPKQARTPSTSMYREYSMFQRCQRAPVVPFGAAWPMRLPAARAGCLPSASRHAAGPPQRLRPRPVRPRSSGMGTMRRAGGGRSGPRAACRPPPGSVEGSCRAEARCTGRKGYIASECGSPFSAQTTAQAASGIRAAPRSAGMPGPSRRARPRSAWPCAAGPCAGKGSGSAASPPQPLQISIPAAMCRSGMPQPPWLRTGRPGAGAGSAALP